ncbi:hypothetical protein [Solicola gregarius]|uniref:Uncharacterized protein n=1 Tax=Solicola gregarius TaxID=2908642 RepID=A0AA46YM18_9ACTN|nr:hypothetical protein [Solicola gregarius]UYM06086.1 hypothetical protein L0C25_03160 [Solicola gregarius]
MEILLWLAAPLAVTALAMLWAAWLGRSRDARATDERAHERLSRAMRRRSRKPLMVATQPHERSSGVAVRPSSRGRGAR